LCKPAKQNVLEANNLVYERICAYFVERLSLSFVVKHQRNRVLYWFYEIADLIRSVQESFA
jgi:hypothetical protein